MIAFITGKPRQGKSFYSVKLVLDELKRADGRVVVTNLVFRRAKILEYLVQYCKIDTMEALRRIDERLVELKAEHARDFFRVRSKTLYLDPRDDISDPQLAFKIPDYAKHDVKGVLYVVDEVHNIYNARRWKDSGELVLWYNSQHGKLCDDCFFITQAPKLVEVQFRMLAFEWHHIRNGYQQKLGPFSARSGFFRKSFYVEPTSNNASPYETERFEFQQIVADCYDTNAGIGLVGKQEPSLRKSAGIPFWCLPVGVGALILCIFVGLNLGTKKLSEVVAVNAIKSGGDLTAAAGIKAPASSAASPPLPGHSPQPAQPVRPDPGTLSQMLPASSRTEATAGSRGDSAWPVAVVSGARAVVYSDGSRAPLERVPHVIRGRWATVEDYRVPVL